MLVVLQMETYKGMLGDRIQLRRLEAAGVDNWDGYDGDPGAEDIDDVVEKIASRVRDADFGSFAWALRQLQEGKEVTLPRYGSNMWLDFRNKTIWKVSADGTGDFWTPKQADILAMDWQYRVEKPKTESS